MLGPVRHSLSCNHQVIFAFAPPVFLTWSCKCSMTSQPMSSLWKTWQIAALSQTPSVREDDFLEKSGILVTPLKRMNVADERTNLRSLLYNFIYLNLGLRWWLMIFWCFLKTTVFVLMWKVDIHLKQCISNLPTGHAAEPDLTDLSFPRKGSE